MGYLGPGDCSLTPTTCHHHTTTLTRLTLGRFASVDLACFSFDRVARRQPLFEKNIV